MMRVIRCGTFLLLAIAAVPHARAQSGTAAPILDNERISVWDVTLAPGQAFSREHPENDCVILFFAGGKVRTTGADGKTRVAAREFGDAVYEPKGTVEKEEVVSSSPVRFFVVELKDHPVPVLVNQSGYPLSFPRPGAKKILENDRIIVWTYTYKPGVPTPMHYHDKDALVVYRYDASVSSTTPDGKSVVNEDKAGTVKFNKGDRLHVEALVKGQESVIATELK
jgi:quercetin dioxygenase-like cupin family protein